jgi:hypothetical protein
MPVDARLVWRLSRAGDYYIIAFQGRNYAGGRASAFQRNMAFVFLVQEIPFAP